MRRSRLWTWYVAGKALTLARIAGKLLIGIEPGPIIDWQHRHPDGILNVGEAMLDWYRKTVPNQCLKIAVGRMRQQDPPNATEMKCDLCSRGTCCLSPGPPISIITDRTDSHSL